MNCRDWEQRIALHAEGDLPAAEARQTAQHLADCPDCRHFAESLKQTLVLLRTAHKEALAPAHLGAVRARVLGRIETRRLPRPLVWISASAPAAAMLLFLLIPRPLEPPRVRIVPPPPETQIVRAAPSVPVPQPVQHPSRAHPKPTIHQPAEPLMVKLETDDPDVVIYWIPN